VVQAGNTIMLKADRLDGEWSACGAAERQDARADLLGSMRDGRELASEAEWWAGGGGLKRCLDWATNGHVRPGQPRHHHELVAIKQSAGAGELAAGGLNLDTMNYRWFGVGRSIATMR
jgi:hypothetical protein